MLIAVFNSATLGQNFASVKTPHANYKVSVWREAMRAFEPVEAEAICGQDFKTKIPTCDIYIRHSWDGLS